MSERPYIVIVDDDKEWCETVRQELLEKQVAGVAAYQNNDEAVRAIAHNPPVHLLIDYCLCEKQENWNFLSRLQEQGMSTSNDKKDCNIWVVSDYPSLDITPLKKRFPAVHRFWFAKPLKSVEDILTKFELVKQARNLSDTINIPINAIPWPVRIFNEQGVPIAVNNCWLNASNRPVHPELDQLKKPTASSTHWGALPGKPQTDNKSGVEDSKPEYGFFNLCTFEFETPKESKYYGQLCDELAYRPQTLPQLIERCFDALRQSGFTQVEYYRLTKMPGSFGVIQHIDTREKDTHENYDNAQEIDKKLYLCIQRKMLHKKSSLAPGDLLYEWVNNKDLALTASNMQPPYAKAPVICRSPWTGKQEVAALILWKHNDATKLSTEECIKPITPLLLALFDQIANKIKQEQQKHRLDRWKQVDEYETKIASYKDQDEMEKELLNIAIELTGARAGYFVGKTLDNRSLPIRTAKGYENTNPQHIPMTAEHFPEVRCQKYKKPYFIPDYRQLPDEKKLTISNCWEILDDKRKASPLLKLINSKRGSICALPIHAGELILGALVLESEHPFHFNQAQIKTAQQLLERTRWHLNAVVEAKKRYQWEHAVMHEIRKGLDVIGKAVGAIEGRNEDNALQQVHLKRAKRNQMSLMDLTDDFLDTLGRPHDSEKNVRFENPRRAIDEFYTLYEEEIEEWKHHTFSFNPTDSQDEIWGLPLKGDFTVFSRVVRNLLHNAIKFSEDHSDIRISASYQDSFWQLLVSNPGELKEEELNQSFVAFAKPARAKQDGSHIGLAANRALVEQVGGTLMLRTSTRRNFVISEKFITAELRWPIYTGDLV